MLLPKKNKPVDLKYHVYIKSTDTKESEEIKFVLDQLFQELRTLHTAKNQNNLVNVILLKEE